jgi:ParB-like chromosome segregation protein Spo0J
VDRPVSDDDPEVVALAESIRRHGLRKPLVVTRDGMILSGHRRKVACSLAGLTFVACRVEDVHSTDPAIPVLLTEDNRQRVKTAAEQVREEVIRTSPEDAQNALLAQRATEAAKAYRRVQDSGLRLLPAKAAATRSVINDAKRPMLDAAIAVIEQYRDYWPLTLRQIHYRLLTRHVLRNANKPETYKNKRGVHNNRYVNNLESYKDLSDLLTRARLIEEVPWESMHDPTRPRTAWLPGCLLGSAGIVWRGAATARNGLSSSSALPARRPRGTRHPTVGDSQGRVAARSGVTRLDTPG